MRSRKLNIPTHPRLQQCDICHVVLTLFEQYQRRRVSARRQLQLCLCCKLNLDIWEADKS